MLFVESSHFCEKYTLYYPYKSLRFTRCHNSTCRDWQLRVCMPYLLCTVLTTDISPSLGASPRSFFIVCTTNILAVVLELVWEFFLIRTSLHISFPYPRGLIFQDILQCKYRFYFFFFFLHCTSRLNNAFLMLRKIWWDNMECLWKIWK